MRRFTTALAVVVLVAGCSDDRFTVTTDASTAGSSTASTVAPTTVVPKRGDLVAMPSRLFPDRPYKVFVPGSYDDATAEPLVISLHGFEGSGAQEEEYIKLQPEADERGFLYIHPDGETSPQGFGFWNATEACCSGDPSVDDSGYLMSIIDEVSATYNVDQSRVFLVGYSNGGFMSYRMACEHADRIAAIVSLGGATFLDPAECAPSEPVSILEIHGDHDETIDFNGGSTLFGTFPSADATWRTWAEYNGCGIGSHALDDIHIDAGQLGHETTPVEYLDCPADGAAELWIIEGGSHSPALAETFPADIVDWLFAHPKMN